MSEEKILKNNAFYSRQYASLMDIVRKDSRMHQQHMMKLPEAVAMGKYYKCHICTWPVIFSKERKEEFEQVIKRVPSLMQKAVSVYFENDSELFSEYLQMSGSILQLLSQVKIDNRDYLVSALKSTYLS